MIQPLYLIISHTNPDQVVRLINTIKTSSPHSIIVIHHDYSCTYLDAEKINSFSNTFLVKSNIKGEWGDFGLVAVILKCLYFIAENNIKYDWLFLLSGMDYPIQKLSVIEEFFDKTDVDGFVDCEIIDNAMSAYGSRYYFHYYKLPLFLKKLLTRIKPFFIKNRFIRIEPGLRRINPRIGIRKMATPFSGSFKCYKGATWFSVNRNCINHILDFISHHTDYIKYYKRTFLSDESFFLTILMNNPGLKMCNDNLRYVSWSSATSAHPDTLIADDYDKLIASGMHFARKFDIHADTRILDMLDEYIQN